MTISGSQPPQIFCRVFLSRNGNPGIAFIGASLLAFCILCVAGNRVYANSLATHDPRTSVSVEEKDFRNQSGRASPSSFSSATLPTEFNASVGVVGIASWYNPYLESGDTLTASGELYDPDEWTAAIQIKLRQQFGKVGYRTNYRPTYALVESGNKRVIVKINDVGPLAPGRVIDLSERAMRYFDESLQLGLLPNVKLTPLAGNWTPGPVDGDLVRTQWCGPGTLDDAPAAVGSIFKANDIQTMVLDL